MRKNHIKILFVLFVVVFQGCASTGTGPWEGQEKVKIPTSYREDEVLSHTPDTEGASEGDEGQALGESLLEESLAQDLAPMRRQVKGAKSSVLLTNLFAENNSFTVAAEEMPLIDFIHYVFAELLGVNYILDDSITPSVDGTSGSIILNLADPISGRELFQLVDELLLERGINVKYGNKTFFIHRPSESVGGPQLVMGIGGDPADVPDTSKKIIQVVPLKFGVKVSLERTLRDLTSLKITPDFSQSALYIEGSRAEIMRALELVEMLDTPAMRGRYIGLIPLSYLEPSDFANQARSLLRNEGVEAGITTPQEKNLVLVPMEKMGALAVFATNQFLLDRVKYWAKIIDVPGDGPARSYFVYHPRFARSVDLEESISTLLDLKTSVDDIGGSGSSTGNAPSAKRRLGSGNDAISLVVDEKANLLIFYTSGDRYKAIQPLLRQLDVMPKQVMLDIMIAEVSMKDEFKYGVEWAFRNGEVTLTTEGAFGASSVGGIGVLIDGNHGPVTGNFFTSNSLVKVLSRPTIMVRDGVTATINVGSTISVVGSTTQDPISGQRQTTESTYRSTGVDVSVTPTVNAAGIVVMEVNKNISNTVPGSSGAGGNPDIFQRSITTEVVARSGQTVMLGGLISENTSSGGSGTPGLANIPLLGKLFKAEGNSTDRTELIMVITPRVVDDLTQWETLMDSFRKSLLFMESK